MGSLDMRDAVNAALEERHERSAGRPARPRRPVLAGVLLLVFSLLLVALPMVGPWHVATSTEPVEVFTVSQPVRSARAVGASTLHVELGEGWSRASRADEVLYELALTASQAGFEHAVYFDGDRKVGFTREGGDLVHLY